jgi:hypothetical protein
MQVEIEFWSGKVITDLNLPCKSYPLAYKRIGRGYRTQQIIIHHNTWHRVIIL